MIKHCIRCGKDVGYLPTYSVCGGCRCLLCEDCITAHDYEGLPSQEPKVECARCDIAMKTPSRNITRLKNIQFVSVSLVDQCPYCGTNDWGKPGRMPDGSVCNHPTKLAVRGVR